MRYQLPEIDVTGQPSLSATQIAALRALVAYICGFRSQQNLFRGTQLSDNDIRSFKQGRLKFVEAPNDSRLHMFYKAVYEWFRDKEIPDPAQLYIAVVPLLDTVFPQGPSANTRERAFGQAADALYELFQVNTDAIRELAEALEGVYYLFRLGDAERRLPELVVCAVRIALRDAAGGPRLVFELRYRRRETGSSVDYINASATMPHVYGTVIPHGDNVSLAGVDEGSGNSPCLCMLYAPARGVRERAIPGMMLRKNTLGRVVSARCILVRAESGSEMIESEELDRLYVQAISRVSIRKCEEGSLADLNLNPSDELSRIRSRITNTIDNRTEYVLIDRLSRQSVEAVASQASSLRGAQGADEDEYDMARLVPPPSRERIVLSATKILGCYLNVRYSPDGQLRLSFMTIKNSTRYNNCLVFETERYNKSGARIGKGLVYRVQAKWIADGIVARHNFDFGMRRLSILHQRQRRGEEVGDMIGVRLTVSPDDKVISAHKVYCYKLVDQDFASIAREKIRNPEHAKITEEHFKEEWPDVFAQVDKELISETPHVLSIEE